MSAYRLGGNDAIHNIALAHDQLGLATENKGRRAKIEHGRIDRRAVVQLVIVGS
jgi:hypothetical protein